MSATCSVSWTAPRTRSAPRRRPRPGSATAAVIGEEDPDFAGGSYVLVQRYLHDLTAWDALSVGEQERVVGRTKLNDIELPDEVKPSNSHVALTTILDEDGGQRQIVRYNMPFGRVGAGEFGTYFIGYARSPDVLEQMVTNMFVGRPPGNYDRILDFSTAISGCLFFVPTIELLEDPPLPGAVASTDSEPAPLGEIDPRAGEESLLIGGLKRALAPQ
jgi:porphyrinogen peroxidase